MRYKFLALAVGFAGLANIGCSALHQDIRKNLYGEYVLQVDPTEANSASHHFPQIFEGLKKGECNVPDEHGNKVKMEKFFSDSKKDERAVNYVENMIEKLKRSDNRGLSELELAIKGVNLFRKDLSKTHGKGKYVPDIIKKGDFKMMREIFDGLGYLAIPFVMGFPPREVLTDFTLPLGKFISNPSGKYEGDCDEFSRSLITAYELMKDIAKDHKDDNFYSKLYEGLKHYKIIGLGIWAHAINASIMYNDDFTIAYFRPFEPFIFEYGGKDTRTKKDEILIQNERVYVLRTYKDGTTKKRLVTSLHSSEVCYEQKPYNHGK